MFFIKVLITLFNNKTIFVINIAIKNKKDASKYHKRASSILKCLCFNVLVQVMLLIQLRK